jgi:hypothetical protein
MSEEDVPATSRARDGDGANSSSGTADRSGSRMCARTWAIAHRFREPADYGVPELPDWTVRRTEGGGLALARDAESEPFVSAADPVTVRR